MEKITRSVLEADKAGQIPTKGVFNLLVNIDEYVVEVRGTVINEQLRYGTFFIPKK